MENIKKIKGAVLEYFEVLHKKRHHQREEKRNDKNSLLEFLEGRLSWLVNSTSQKVLQLFSFDCCNHSCKISEIIYKEKNSMHMDYTAEFRYDEDKEEYYIHIPNELQETLEWEEGDILDYSFENNKLIIENISL